MSFAWSTDIDADVVAIIQTVIDAGTTTATVFDGRATQGAVPPFVTCWHLDPELGMAGMAGEDFGQANQRWQISAHGTTQGQARYLAETVAGHDWPAGWELYEIGPMVEDMTDKPGTWFMPLRFVFRGMT